MNNVEPSISSEVVTHLQMIQSTIDRMCTSSAIYKGFAATIVAGISVASFSDINKWILVLAFVMVLSFLSMDVYYLQLERRFRFLYEQVRTGEISSNYELQPPKQKDINKIQKKNKARLIACLFSKSILPFYLPLIIICLIIILMKFSSAANAEPAESVAWFVRTMN